MSKIFEYMETASGFTVVMLIVLCFMSAGAVPFNTIFAICVGGLTVVKYLLFGLGCLWLLGFLFAVVNDAYERFN